MNHSPDPISILSLREDFQPLAGCTLPPLEDARMGALPVSPTVLRERMDGYFEWVCLIHYHVGLVRIVDALPDLEGIRLTGPAQTGMTMKGHIGAVVGKPGDAGKRACSKAEKALSALRSSLPRDIRSIELLLGGGALVPGEDFLLTTGTAAMYLARIGRRQPELNAWLAQSRVAETFGQTVPTARRTQEKPRM